MLGWITLYHITSERSVLVKWGRWRLVANPVATIVSNIISSGHHHNNQQYNGQQYNRHNSQKYKSLYGQWWQYNGQKYESHQYYSQQYNRLNSQKYSSRYAAIWRSHQIRSNYMQLRRRDLLLQFVGHAEDGLTFASTWHFGRLTPLNTSSFPFPEFLRKNISHSTRVLEYSALGTLGASPPWTYPFPEFLFIP